jgi:ribosome biogenesis GTPase
MTNEDLGYNDTFEAGRLLLGLGDLAVARVISESRGAYQIKNAAGEYRATITGRQVFTAASRESYPAVGDWVTITTIDDKQAVIHDILPRQTILKRKYGDKSKSGEKDALQLNGTNIDVAFIVESVDRDYNLNRFERYFVIAQNGGVSPAIILNKTDLLSSEELENKLTELEARFPDITVIPTSTKEEAGLRALTEFIQAHKTYCFLGSSGVGKSSLINQLLATESIKTSDISSYSGRGTHTTTARQMYFLQNGGIVIDNPGTREVGIAEGRHSVEIFFDDITALATGCKFVDCTHTHEPGCRVTAAVKAGELDEARYQNYLNLKKEAEFADLSNSEKRLKDRRFGKFIKNAKKELKDK